jgi:hypothetical protein
VTSTGIRCDAITAHEARNGLPHIELLAASAFVTRASLHESQSRYFHLYPP